MKHLLRFFALLLGAACALLLSSCASASIPVSGGTDAIAAPYSPGFQAKTAPTPAIKINLFGGDLDQFQAVYPGGPTVAIAGLKTSPAFGMATQTIGDAVRWMGMGKIANSFFADKSNTTTQAARTARARISSDAATKQAKIAADAATKQAELSLLPAAAGE
jgi:hypothetical protein